MKILLTKKVPHLTSDVNFLKEKIVKNLTTPTKEHKNFE